MQTKRSQAGYKRPDRPSPQKMVTLPKIYWEWVEKQGMRSEVLRDLVEQAMLADLEAADA